MAPFSSSTTSLSDVLSAIQHLVRAVASLNTTLTKVFPQTGSTSATATAGAATLPADPLGFLVTALPDGTTVKIPYYAE